MKRLSLAILGAAALSAGSAIAVQATAIEVTVVNDTAVLETRMPRALSEYGFFADAAGQIPSASVTPYRLNTPLYTDSASKLRFAYVPEGKQAVADGEGLLKFPVGSALIKTFAYGEGEDRRLIETRVLLHRADGWLALPYKWNDEQTEAKLALVGARLDVDTPEHGTISYRVPNKNQCKQCHSIDDTVVPIGPKARNLSSDWMAAMVKAGHVDAMPQGTGALPVWEHRQKADLNDTARAYLDVNCAHCHQPQGKASNSGLDLRWEQDDPTSVGIRKRPVAAGRGSGGLNFSIVPGDSSRSIMVHRMGSDNPGVAMPELGKTTVDKDGVDVITRWIDAMPEKTF